LETSSVEAARIPVPAWPDVAASAPRGNAAAFFFRGGTVYIATGLPHSPSVRTVNPGSDVNAISRLGVGFDGSLLIYSVKDGIGESLYSWTPTAPRRFIASAKSVGAIAITVNGGAIVADRGATDIFAVWDLRGNPRRQILADERDGVAAPVGVTVTARNEIYVANARSVMAFDAAGRLARLSPCSCAPSGIYWMKDSLFRLTDRGDQTVYLLSAGAEDRILFVPPLNEIRKQ
jgi:hypothetical protein